MTDRHLVREIEVWPCELGHVHILAGLGAGGEALMLLTPSEAFAFALAVIRAAADADDALRDLMSGPGRGDGDPCSTKH